MQQTFTFWGIFMYLLNFWGCGDNINTSSSPSPTIETTIALDRYQIACKESLEKWVKNKEIHHNSYEYVLYFESVEGSFSYATTIVVQNGIISQRQYKHLQHSYQNNEKTSTEIKSWTENTQQIGDHKEGFPAKTLDQIYLDCDNTYLKDRLDSDHVYFEAEHKGIISLCGYVPNDCADDCFEGVSIQSFKWLQ